MSKKKKKEYTSIRVSKDLKKELDKKIEHLKIDLTYPALLKYLLNQDMKN